MYLIKKECKIELVKKKSKFITCFMHIISEKQAKEVITQFKELHRSADHHPYAWRLLKDSGQVYIKRGDDGEPTGTSGAPMLAVLVGENLVNILAITARYYGGTKLGTGGLATMYKKGVVEALKESGKVKYEKKLLISIQAPIHKADHLLSLLTKQEIPILEKIFTHDVVVHLKVNESLKSTIGNIAQQVEGQMILF